MSLAAMRNYIETDPNYTETFRIKTASSGAFLVMESIYALLLKIFARVSAAHTALCKVTGVGGNHANLRARLNE